MKIVDAVILIGAIRKSGYRPNEWESSFIKSIVGQIELNEALSEKQSSKLQQIYRNAIESMSLNERL
jgi:hypothetical protein